MQEYDFDVLTLRDVGFLPYNIYVIKKNDQGIYLSYLDLTIHGNIPYSYDNLVYNYWELKEKDRNEFKLSVKHLKTVYSNVQGLRDEIKSKVRKRV